jgi:hypothetical protein
LLHNFRGLGYAAILLTNPILQLKF